MGKYKQGLAISAIKNWFSDPWVQSIFFGSLSYNALFREHIHVENKGANLSRIEARSLITTLAPNFYDKNSHEFFVVNDRNEIVTEIAPQVYNTDKLPDFCQ